MALEEDIVAWSKDRPAWQREVMRRTAAGALFSEGEYDQLVEEILKSPDTIPGPAFGLEHLPKVTAEDSPVRIISIAKPKHVNALASDQPLTFEVKGLTIVYGDNGSGKSGYARLLKRIMRARHQEEVLSDVFRDTTLEKPTASLSVRIGDRDESLSWPDSTPRELKRMLFYDGACGSDYISTESDFPYRPTALAVMDGLISTCVAIRIRLETKLAENTRSSAIVPVVADELKNTDAGRLLNQLSASTSVTTLDALIARFDALSETIDDLKNDEARLRTADTSKERQRLTRQAEKLEALRKHVEHIHSMLGNEGLTALQKRRDQLKALQDAANLLARSFESEPLPGVGTSSWKVLWESARRFSEEHAYRAQAFPVLEDHSRCVLCQETLGADRRNRFSRFERFVKDDTQVHVDAERRVYDRQVESLNNLQIAADAVVSDQKDLDATHATLISEIQALLDKYQDARNTTLDAIAGTAPVALFGIEPLTALNALTQAATTARDMATGLANPAIVQGRLAATTAKRQELELMQAIKNSREGIIKEIARLKERAALEAAKTAAATGPITKKVLELSEESITEVVRDTFTRETDRLRLERVTIARTRADKGALLHQPKLVGARQDVKLPRVFSEGERTALGLAAFFTEAHLDGSMSALVLDDPVTSLDHIRRGLVAARLAELAESRQVIMFTHDVSFVADLKREASGKGVPVAERSVTRSRADERKPGACSTKHPWKASDVTARLTELRQRLNQIRNKSGACDEKEYEETVAVWAGDLSETWERIFSHEIVGQVLAEGGLEVRPKMVKILARFSNEDYQEFDASYSRISQWLKRHDKSTLVNFVAPDIATLDVELGLVEAWFKRVKGYKA
jgi:energy-coupling factor transporter ATP-binding protein EcfA2